MTDRDRMEPPAELRAHIARDLEPLARQRRRLFAVLAIAMSVVALGLSSQMGIRSADTAPAHLWPSAGVLLFAGIGLFALAIGLRLPAGRRLRPIAAGAFLGTAALLASFVRADGAAGGAQALWHAGVHCTWSGGLISVGLVATVLIVARRVLRRHAPTWILVGLAAGLTGLVPLHLHCPADSATHVMAWHLCVPVLAIGASWLLFFFFRPQPEPTEYGG